MQYRNCVAALRSARTTDGIASAQHRARSAISIALRGARDARNSRRYRCAQRANLLQAALSNGLKIFPNARALITRKSLTPKEMLPQVSPSAGASTPERASARTTENAQSQQIRGRPADA